MDDMIKEYESKGLIKFIKFESIQIDTNELWILRKALEVFG